MGTTRGPALWLGLWERRAPPADAFRSAFGASIACAQPHGHAHGLRRGLGAHDTLAHRFRFFFATAEESSASLAASSGAA